MANNHKPKTARRLQNTLTSPMTVEQMRQAIDKDSFIEGTVEVELSEVIDTNLEGFLDLISERLTGSILLENITYGIAGRNGDTLHIRVRGNASSILEMEEKK